MPARRPPRAERYAPARRLAEVRGLLNSGEGASVYDIAERFAVSVRTAIRYIRALQVAGEPLYEEIEGRRKVWRLMASARQQTVTLTTAQMVALFLSRRVFDFLAGTGFKEDLDDLFGKLEAQLRRKDFASARNLDRKVFDVNEARHLYEGRIEDVNDIVTALLREERLRVTHESVSGGKKTFVLEPYTLMVYKKGLYLVGEEHGHGGALRTFALDAFREVEWLRGETFDYPADLPAGAGHRGGVRVDPGVGGDARADPVRRQGGQVRGAGPVAPHAAVQAHGGGAGDDDGGAGHDGGGGVGAGVRGGRPGHRARRAPNTDRRRAGASGESHRGAPFSVIANRAARALVGIAARVALGVNRT